MQPYIKHPILYSTLIEIDNYYLLFYLSSSPCRKSIHSSLLMDWSPHRITGQCPVHLWIGYASSSRSGRQGGAGELWRLGTEQTGKNAVKQVSGFSVLVRCFFFLLARSLTSACLMPAMGMRIGFNVFSSFFATFTSFFFSLVVLQNPVWELTKCGGT